MAKVHVVILSDHSLFTEGIASLLQQYPQQVEVSILNPGEQDTMVKISELCPSALIIDASEPKKDVYYALCLLLFNSPGLKVIRLDPEQSEVQIITSAHKKVSDVLELVNLV